MVASSDQQGADDGVADGRASCCGRHPHYAFADSQFHLFKKQGLNSSIMCPQVRQIALEEEVACWMMHWKNSRFGSWNFDVLGVHCDVFLRR